MSTAPTGLALYVVTGVPWRLVRLDYRAGVEVQRVEVARHELLAPPRGPTIHDGRVLYSNTGGVMDLATGAVRVPPSGSVRGLDGERLIVERAEGAFRRLWAIDLDRFEETALPPPNRWQLPGVRSPNGLRTVATDGEGPHAGPAEVWLYEPGQRPRPLAEGLRVPLTPGSSYPPDRPPRLWLNDERILTQRDNGELIVLRDDGAVVGAMSLPLDGRDRQPMVPPRLKRDLDGRIIYSCGSIWRINLADREWGGYPWRPLGSGFAVETGPGSGGWAVTHRGESIGRVRLGAAVACPGHLAVTIGQGLSVWSVEAGWQLTSQSVRDAVGWVDRREEMT